MTTTLSTSSIGSVDPDYVAEEQQDSFRSLDKLEDATAFSAQPIKFAYALVSAMASGPVIYRSLALLSVCLYMTYLGISYRRAFVPDDGRLEVH